MVHHIYQATFVPKLPSFVPEHPARLPSNHQSRSVRSSQPDGRNGVPKRSVGPPWTTRPHRTHHRAWAKRLRPAQCASCLGMDSPDAPPGRLSGLREGRRNRRGEGAELPRRLPACERCGSSVIDVDLTLSLLLSLDRGRLLVGEAPVMRQHWPEDHDGP